MRALAALIALLTGLPAQAQLRADLGPTTITWAVQPDSAFGMTLGVETGAARRRAAHCGSAASACSANVAGSTLLQYCTTLPSGPISAAARRANFASAASAAP